jgi:hypothetical protein
MLFTSPHMSFEIIFPYKWRPTELTSLIETYEHLCLSRLPSVNIQLMACKIRLQEESE